MKIGLHLSDLTYPSGPAGLADDLTRIAVADEIEKTAQVVLDVGEKGEKVDEFLAELARLAGLGIRAVQGKLPNVWELDRIKLFEREVIPAAEL